MSSGGLSSRVMTRDLSMWLGHLKELGAEKKHLKNKCSRRSKQKLQDFRSPRPSLPLCSVSQAVTEAGLDPRAGELDHISHERSNMCVQEGRSGRGHHGDYQPHVLYVHYVIYPHVNYWVATDVAPFYR